jgi:hypothetical protein
MNRPPDSPKNRVALFQRKQVRRTIHNNEWWFVMTDVIFALTDSTNPSDYLKKMRRRDPLLSDAFKGGDKLPPPLHSLLKPKGGYTSIKEQRDYAILTAEISQAAFGLTPAEYARHKKLDRQNLRDHMTDLELIFSMLGEASTTEIACSRDTQGFQENKHAARQGGSVAGHARQELEKKTGRKVVTSDNYLSLAPAQPKRKSPARKKLRRD